MKTWRRLPCAFDLDESERNSTQGSASACKAWPNWVGTRPKLSTCAYSTCDFVWQGLCFYPVILCAHFLAKYFVLSIGWSLIKYSNFCRSAISAMSLKKKGDIICQLIMIASILTNSCNQLPLLISIVKLKANFSIRISEINFYLNSWSPCEYSLTSNSISPSLQLTPNFIIITYHSVLNSTLELFSQIFNYTETR